MQKQEMLFLRYELKRQCRLASWHRAHQSRHNPAAKPRMDSLVSETNFFPFPLEDLTNSRFISLSVCLGHLMLTLSCVGVQSISDFVHHFQLCPAKQNELRNGKIQYTFANPFTVSPDRNKKNSVHS
jgi:hypothetical protein